jgi:phosphoglycerol transferase MdoB-like AlkP superfamily enzyme
VKSIPVFAGTVFRIFFVHLLLFSIARASFICANLFWYENQNLSFSLLANAFLAGLRFDINVLAYALTLPCVLLFLNEMLAAKAFRICAAALLYIFLPLSLLIVCADIPYYLQFQKHLTREAFVWFGHGTTSLRLLFSDMNYWGYLLLFLPLGFTSVKATQHFLKRQSDKRPDLIISSATFLFITAFAIVGIRGRLGKTALHPGVAYTSEVMLTNQAALNANFTLAYSFLFPDEENTIFQPSNDLSSYKKAQNYLGITGPDFVRNVNQADTIKPLNVIVVLMESMSSFKTGAFHQKVLTPNLVNLEKESVWFSNFYSSGVHTYSGIFSTITGYPTILHKHALENYVYKKFDCLPSNLKQEGYQTMFFVPHDEQFDNMAGFLTFNGVDQIFSDKDMPSSESLGAMGVPDHKLFDFTIDKLNTARKPFFALVLTGSDHGPWEIPSDLPWKPDGKDEQERATQYADWSIGHFIEKAKKQEWFNNTLFVFLGDHGSNHGRSYHMDIAFNQVPCLFYCPTKLTACENDDPSVQMDVFPTIMGILGYGYQNRTFGLDLLKQKRPYAFFSQDDRMGCLDNDHYYYDLLFWGGKEYLVEYKELHEKNLMTEKPRTADSLKNYMMTMLQAANYILVNQKY